MDDNDFLNAFMNVDILKVEGASKIIGCVIAKLREGMISGGSMESYEADVLINTAFKTFMLTMNEMYGGPQR